MHSFEGRVQVGLATMVLCTNCAKWQFSGHCYPDPAGAAMITKLNSNRAESLLVSDLTLSGTQFGSQS